MGNITIGVTGTGDTSLKNAKALITDHLEGNHPDDAVAFVLDLTLVEGQLPNAVRAAVELAKASQASIKAVLPSSHLDDPGDDQWYLDALALATTTVKAANAQASVARSCDVLLLAWAETEGEDGPRPSEGSVRALQAAERHGVPALDLTEGLLPLAFEDDSDDSDAPVPQPDESTSSVQPNADSAQTGTLSTDRVEVIASKVAAAVLAEILPLIEKIIAQTAPKPRGRPRKVTDPEE